MELRSARASVKEMLLIRAINVPNTNSSGKGFVSQSIALLIDDSDARHRALTHASHRVNVLRAEYGFSSPSRLLM